ncbi:hypothetical protein BKA63DRAFT_528546 [Paraphoma chrysanthemicola]|nr:hypothetical protein BKA63DRAFT_528546 [Paraphoma chrysanthemicola]
MIEDGTKYGTDHERYRISGVVRLSDLAEHPHPIPDYHLSPEYIRKKTAVQHRLREEKWEPTLKRNRLTARISSSTWMIIVRQNSVQLGDGRHYPTLVIPKDADVKIESGTAILSVLRSGTVSSANWCIVDFLLCDVPCYEYPAVSGQLAVCSSLKAAAKCTNTTSLPYQASLTPHHNKAIRLACRISALVEPLEPLLAVNGFFQTVSLNMWEDARRTWCHEEFSNYLNYMQSQWRDILLGFDPRVTSATDTETILMLQSRAPAVSHEDRSFLAKRFEERLLFPRLTDQALRRQVEVAVYRQGPILTVKTFACDIKILRARILAPLKEALGPMRASQNRTVRNKLLDYFRDRYIDHVPMAIGVCAAKERYAVRCFERLFLRLMQTATRTLSLHEDDVRAFARQEFLELNRNDLTASPTSRDDYVDLPVEKRHGVRLYKRIADAGWVLSDIIREPYPPDSPVSEYFMCKYITSLFLLGKTPPLNSSMPPAATIATSLPMTAAAPSRLPFHSSNSPCTQSLSTCSSASDAFNETWSASHYAWSASTQHMCGDHRREPQFATFANFISQKGSIAGSHSSTVSSIRGGNQKRGMVSYEDTVFIPEQKRPCLTRSVISVGSASPTLAERSPIDERQIHQRSCRASFASTATSKRASHAGENRSLGHAYSTPSSSLDERECYQRDAFSSSDYDRSWTPTTRRSTTALPNIAFLQEADSYKNLVDIAHRQCDVVRDGHGQFSSDVRKQKPSVTLALAPSCTVAAAPCEGPEHKRAMPFAKRDAIVFELSGNKSMCYRSTRTQKSLCGFIRSQLMVDASSNFSYTIDGKTYDAPTEAHLLERLPIIDVVVVHSEQGHFASTQHPSIVHASPT